MSTAAVELDRRITETLGLKGPQTMEHLVRTFPDVTWAQVFSAVDRLSRSGKVLLQQSPHRDYLIGLRSPFLPQSVLGRRIAARNDRVVPDHQPLFRADSSIQR